MSDDSAATRRFCPSCGTRCHVDWQYCAACGGELPAPMIRDAAAPSHAAPNPSVRERFAALVEQRQQAVTQPPETASQDAPAPLEVTEPVAPPGKAELDPEPAGPEVTSATSDEPRTRPAGPATANPDAVESRRSPSRARRDRAGDRRAAASSAVDVEIAEPRRQGTVTGYVQLATLVAAALAVAVVGGLVSLNARLTDFTRTGAVDPVNDAESLVENVFQPLFFASMAVVLAGLSWWTLRRRRELHALTLEESRFSDVTAVVSWLIPVVNLVIPVLVLDEMWRAGRARSHGRRLSEEAPNPWLWAWSGLVGVGVLIAVFAALLSPESIERTMDANTWSAIGYALIGLGLLALVVTTSAVATTLRFPLRTRPEERERTVELLSVD